MATTAYLERVQLDGPERQARFDLVGTQVKLGRDHNNDFVLPCLSLSKSHAEFQFRNEQWEVRTMTSGGIQINHEHMVHDEFVVLKNNDVISFIPDDRSVDYRFASCENLKRDNEHAAGQSIQSLQASVPGPSTVSSSPGRTNCRKRTETECVDTCCKVPKICEGPSFDSDDAVPVTQQTLASTAHCLESPSQRGHVTKRPVSLQEKLVNLLDYALSCPVCIEVAIEPSAGNCGHIFCSHCITVLNERSKNPSNPMCPLCANSVGSPTRLSRLDTLISDIFDFLPSETQENRKQMLKHRQQEHEKWRHRQNTSQIELGGGINQVEDEAREALPESDDVTVHPSAPSVQPDDETTRNVRQNDKVKRKKRNPDLDRSFELLFVPVLDGYSPSLTMDISAGNNGDGYFRVRHSIKKSTDAATTQRGSKSGSTETSHVTPGSSVDSGSLAPLALNSEQPPSKKRAPLSRDDNDWFQAHRFIFRFEDPNGGRLTKKGLNFVERHIRQFLRPQYGYHYPSPDSAQGNHTDTPAGEMDVDGNRQSCTQGTESATTTSSSRSIPTKNTANMQGSSSMPIANSRPKLRGDSPNPIVWEIRTITIPPLVFPLRSSAPSPAPHHIIFTEIDQLRFGELDFPRSPASRHHLVPSPSPSLASNVSVWSDVFAGAGGDLGEIDPASPLQFIPEDILVGEEQDGAGLVEHDHFGAVDQPEPLSQSLEDGVQNAVSPAVIGLSPPVSSSSALPTFAHPEEHNSRAVSPQLPGRRLEFSVIPPTYTPGVTPKYKIIGKLVYDLSETALLSERIF